MPSTTRVDRTVRNSPRRAGGGRGLLTAVVLLVSLALPAITFAAGKTPATKVTGALVTFYIFAALALFGAVMTITRRNPVSAAMFLVLTLLCTAGVYLTLHATFLAAIQVLVYAGAVMVLFIFVVMSVGKIEDAASSQLLRSWPAKVLGLLATGALIWRIAGVLGDPKLIAKSPAVASTYGNVESMGELLFSTYLFPFEAISILLLVAIVGAVMVTRRPAPEAPQLGETEGGAR